MNLPHLSDRRRATLRRAAQCAAGLGAGVALLIPAAADAACTYGPDQCKPGFVWRDGFANDHACVTPPERAVFLQQNAQANARRSPNGGPYGPNTCLPGYVWREAWPNDQVCVTGAERAQAQQSANLAAANRDPACAVTATAPLPVLRPGTAFGKTPTPALDGTKPGTPSGPTNASTGLARIMNAGVLPAINPSVNPGTPIQVQSFIPGTDGQGPRIITTSGFKGGVENAMRRIEDAIFLSDANLIYPGAILQGKNFTNGLFAPVTIPRAPGMLSINNLNLAQGAAYSKQVPDMSGASVQAAIQQLLGQGVVGTAAGASFQTYETNSQSKLLFDLGVDVRYGAVSVNGQLSTNTSTTKNYVFAVFRQKFYDVSFQAPAMPTDVFRDHENFTDPLNQIVPGNPPLLVSKVSYGRMILFRAESEQSTSDISAALNAAYNGGASVKVNSKLTASQVLNATQISYIVVGGNAANALKPIAASNGDMYTAVRNAIAAESAANYSAANPGVPISYTLTYLKSNEVASMGYSTGPYDQTELTSTSLPKSWSTQATCYHRFNDPGDNDENTLQVKVEWNAVGVPQDQYEFRLITPAPVTWRKWMKILRHNSGSPEEIWADASRTSAGVGFYGNEIGPRSQITLSKGKFLGAKTDVFSLTDGFQYLQPGTRVTFIWLRDSRSLPDDAPTRPSCF